MNKPTVKFADQSHMDFLQRHDSHISRNLLHGKIENQEILVLECCESPVGWLRFGLFWDEIPFMNLLFILEDFRGKGYGRLLVKNWEKAMAARGFKLLLTSTLANEEAQHFYRKLGYTDIGGFVLPAEPMEIILMKSL